MSAVDDFVIANYHSAFEAFQAGDFARLEEMAKDSPFPCGTDGWIGRHWLSTAIETGNPDAVAWVLSKRPKIDYVDSEGFTALMTCVQLEYDSPPLDPDDAMQRTIRIIDLLCDAGATINLGATLGETVLHAAARWSSPAVVRHLLAKGADPTVWDHEYVPRQPADYAKDMKRWEVHAILREAMGQTPAGR